MCSSGKKGNKEVRNPVPVTVSLPLAFQGSSVVFLYGFSISVHIFLYFQSEKEEKNMFLLSFTLSTVFMSFIRIFLHFNENTQNFFESCDFPQNIKKKTLETLKGKY